MSNNQQYNASYFFKQMLAGGLAGSFAEVLTLPLDTAKVRLQIQGGTGLNPSQLKYRGMIQTMITIAGDEGVLALWKGLSAGLARQMINASLRIGLYDPIKNFYSGGKETPNLVEKILAGLTTGAIGISVANPTDVIKVRFQAEAKLPEGVPRRYNGFVDAGIKIYQQEGIRGLWTGVGPNILRNAIINAAELVTYDHTKHLVLKHNLLKDNIFCHFIVSAWAGFVATVIGSPVDVIKTRIMKGDKAKGDAYKNVFDCIYRTQKEEGFKAFYKGFNANASRIISWNIVMFMAREQLLIAFGFKSAKH